MDTNIAKKWISKRLGSWDYRKFLLANLFYDGFVPPIEWCGLDFDWEGFELEKCSRLVYNPLKRNIKKKMNYLLSRPYSVVGNDDVKEYLQDSVQVLKDTVTELYNKGETWWEIEPDSTSPIKFKITLRKAESIVPHYTDEEQTRFDAVGYLWNFIDEEENVYKYVDFVDLTGRHRLPLYSDKDELMQDLGHAVKNGASIVFKKLPFIRLSTDGLYEQIDSMGKMYSDRYEQADKLLQDNADPVAIIKNASNTDGQILLEDIKINKVVTVEGTGDFSYASKSMDYSSIESFMKLLKSDISDICGVVSREQELNYVTSGRALDRLYVDMDNDAADMGSVLREALKEFLSFVGEQNSRDYISDFDIIFNTDKPTDETQIISNISSSSSMLSKRTLLEQHPWVKDVDEELARIEEESSSQSTETEPGIDLMLEDSGQQGEEPMDGQEEEV